MTDLLTSFSKDAQSIKVGGIYEHYKKLPYKVLSIARHSETLEEMVVYQALYGECQFWVRPVTMFLENVLVDGTLVSRFRLIS
jgi:hypothetical protein